MTRYLAEQVDAREWMRRYDRRQRLITVRTWAGRIAQGAFLFGIGALCAAAVLS